VESLKSSCEEFVQRVCVKSLCKEFVHRVCANSLCAKSSHGKSLCKEFVFDFFKHMVFLHKSVPFDCG